MMRKFLTILVFIVLAMPIYYFASTGLQGITGHAIKTDDGTGPNGVYRIKPNFQIKMVKNLEYYKELREDARKLVSEAQICEYEKPLNECLKGSWSRDCGNDKEKLFTEIAEKYMICSQSKDNYCLCEIELGMYADGVYKMIIEDDEKGTHFELEEHEHLLDNVHPDIDADGAIIRGSGTGGKYEINIEYDEEFIGSDIELDELMISVFKDENLVSEHEFEDKLYYFKIDDQMILVPLDKYENALAEAENNPDIELRQCWLPNKRIHKFCPNSGETLYVKDKVVKEHDLIYQFAIDFSDSVAPPQTEIMGVKNIDDDKESLFVTWQASTVTDFDHYMLFVSDEPFTDITGLQPAAFLKENQYILKEYPEKDNLLRIKDGVTYHVTIVPVDKSNNHVTQITYQNEGVSVDNKIS